MTYEEAKMQIQAIPEKIWDQLSEPDREAMEMAFSALQAQEAKAQLFAEGTTPKAQKTCITCKHYPPESKWPCIDCDMRNPADRWEPQELSKNSTELDKGNGELHPTCTGSCTGNEELKQEVKHSTESSSTHKALDTIKPMRAIDANKLLRDIEKYHLSDGKFQHWVQIQPTIEPETCEDAVSRNAIIQKLNTMDRYVSEELILCDTDKKFPKNEVFIVDDVYEEIVENLPSAHSEIEERKEESAQNVPKEDLISRKAAIDALKNERSDWNCDYNVPVDHCIDAIYSVPSAQPDTKAQLPGEGTTFDLISRQAAIDALVKAIRKDPYYDTIMRAERRTDDLQ